MSLTTKTIGTSLALALAVGAVVAPGSVAAGDQPGAGRTATELGQAVGEPGEAATGTVTQSVARTPTELGQAVGEPGDAAHAGDVIAAPASGNESSGVDWGGFALVTGGLAAAIGIGAVVLFARRRSPVRSSRSPV